MTFISEEPEILTYRFNCVVFGVNSSPFLLNAVLKHHIETYKDIDPQFVSKLTRGFYVHDLVTGCKSGEEALYLFNKANDRMLEGGFKLRKWKTNSYELRENIQQSEKLSEIETESKLSPTPMEYSYAQESLGPVQKPGGEDQSFEGGLR